MCLTANQRSPAESIYSIDIVIYIYTQKASPKLQSAPIHISMNQGALLYTDVFSFDYILTLNIFGLTPYQVLCNKYSGL